MPGNRDREGMNGLFPGQVVEVCAHDTCYATDLPVLVQVRGTEGRKYCSATHAAAGLLHSVLTATYGKNTAEAKLKAVAIGLCLQTVADLDKAEEARR